MQLQFIGCGDAFGSGGRMNTCFHVTGEQENLLIDCGASALVGLKRHGIDRERIAAILITHFHADHFGGLPFFMMDAGLVAKRQAPLVVAGPKGIEARYVAAMAAAFPGSPPCPERFSLRFVEVEPGVPQSLAGARVSAWPVVHTEAAGPCLGYRIELGGRVLAYSGDTEWTDTLITIGKDADLFVCEAYTRERPVRHHLALAALERRLAEIAPRQLVLTHMSEDMLAQRHGLPYRTAEDGLIFTF